MHPAEVDNALETMVCLVDTREQDTPRFRARLENIGLPIERKALQTGDYGCKVQLPNDEWMEIPVAIERKMNIDELCMCYTHERSRFTKEFDRAKNAQKRLYLLVEGATWSSIYSGQYRSHMRSQSLVGSILTWLARYDCILLFCPVKCTGQLIRDVLFYEAREFLLKAGDDN